MLSWIWRKVDSLVYRHKTYNPFELAEACNYYIQIQKDVPTSVWGSFIRTGKSSGMITINDRLSQPMKYLVASHELAHGVLGHQNTVDNEFLLALRWFNMIKEERHANMFAVHLLCKGYDWSHGDLRRASRDTGIPLALLQEYVNARGIKNLIQSSRRHLRRTARNFGSTSFYF